MSTRTTVDFNSRQVHEHSRSRIPACLGNAEESVGSRSASVGSFRVFSLLACVCALRPERRCGGDGPREGRVVISPSALPSTVKFLSALRCEELRRSVIAVGTTDTRGPRSRQNQEPMPEFKKTRRGSLLRMKTMLLLNIVGSCCCSRFGVKKGCRLSESGGVLSLLFSDAVTLHREDASAREHSSSFPKAVPRRCTTPFESKSCVWFPLGIPTVAIWCVHTVRSHLFVVLSLTNACQSLTLLTLHQIWV